MLKGISAAISILLCLSALVSCGNTSTDSDFGMTDSDSAKQTEPLQTEAPQPETIVLHGGNPDNAVWAEAYLKSLPDADYDGASFFITSPETVLFDPSEVKYMSEVIYARNKAVEEKYNIKIGCGKSDISSMLDGAAAAVNSGMYYSDIMSIPMEYVGEFAVSGVLENLRSLPFLDLSEPYFNASSVNALSAGDMIYGAAGESTPSLSAMPVVYFNKTLLSSVTETSPYDDALRGELTWDKLLEYAALADGADGIAGAAVSEGDVSDIVFASAGEKFINSAERTVPTVGFADGAMDAPAPYVRKIFDLGDKNGISRADASAAFREGSVMFTVGYLSDISSYLSESVSLGILPIPKISADAPYRSLVNGTAPVMTVMKGPANSSMVSLTLSAINAASYGYIAEKYVDYLHITALPDNRSAYVLEEINRSAVYDLSSAFHSVYPEIWDNTRGLVRNVIERGDFSGYAAHVSAAEKAMASAFPCRE